MKEFVRNDGDRPVRVLWFRDHLLCLLPNLSSMHMLQLFT